MKFYVTINVEGKTLRVPANYWPQEDYVELHEHYSVDPDVLLDYEIDHQDELKAVAVARMLSSSVLSAMIFRARFFVGSMVCLILIDKSSLNYVFVFQDDVNWRVYFETGVGVATAYLLCTFRHR